MKNQEISKGNGEICKMLSFVESKENIYRVPNNFPYNEDSGWTEWSVDCIEFHSDWNMLIGAHNKARELFMKLDKDIQKDFLESDKNYIVRFGLVNFFSTFENQYTISSCWQKMVDFANWYNNLTVKKLK